MEPPDQNEKKITRDAKDVGSGYSNLWRTMATPAVSVCDI